MADKKIACQGCLFDCKNVIQFMNHLDGNAHRKKTAELFQKDEYWGPVRLPFIVTIDAQNNPDIVNPLIGLSLVTMCWNSELRSMFCLCHVCEETCSLGQILPHLFSADHYSNFFSYMDPDVMSLSWIPSMNFISALKPMALKYRKNNGSGVIQVLDVPAVVFTAIKDSSYSKVMHTLNQNEKLVKSLKASKPERMTIQTYQMNPNRKHPLLGLQHLVEFRCIGPLDKCSYLCTLCRLTFAAHKIINHILSFDHIYWYLKVWHPSTLLPKDCYKNYTSYFSTMMQDFASQAEAIHRIAITDIKQLTLEPALFTSVDFSCYAKAFAKLESIRKEHGESSLMATIKPGNKLVHLKNGPQTKNQIKSPDSPASHTETQKAPTLVDGTTSTATEVNSTAPSAAEVNSTAPSAAEVNSTAPTATEVNSTAPTATEVNSTAPTATEVNSTAPTATEVNSTAPTATEVNSTAPTATEVNSKASAAVPPPFSTEQPLTTDTKLQDRVVMKACRLYCQDCKIIFEDVWVYTNHVKNWTHRREVENIFGQDGSNHNEAVVPMLTLYKYAKNPWMRTEPVIGLPLIVIYLSSIQPISCPVYLCFACQDKCSSSGINRHLCSPEHLKNTLMYQNPCRLPFAWKDKMANQVLKKLAWEEERAQGPDDVIVKVYDVSGNVFDILSNSSTFEDNLRTFEHFDHGFKLAVPPCVSLKTLQKKQRFPVLGPQFLVQHSVSMTDGGQTSFGWGFLCLLCRRRMSRCEFAAHVFSHEHVTKYLDIAHPNSLSRETKKNPETLLDLAEQAAEMQTTSENQVIKMSNPIKEPFTYMRAFYILKTKTKRDRNGALVTYLPARGKLVPRGTLREIDKERVRKMDDETKQKNSKMAEEMDKESGKGCSDKSDATSQPIPVKKNMESGKQHSDKTETPPPVTSKTIPPVKRKIPPPVTSETILPVKRKTPPPVTSDTIPPVKRKIPPPVTSETILPVKRKTPPPVTSDTIPPVKRKIPPPVTSETILPVKRKTPPPITNETILPVKRETPPPVTSETTPPVTSETIPPVKRKTLPPVTSETTPPVTSETILPVKRKTPPPVTSETTPPVTSETIPPVKRETPPPVTSVTILPVKRKTPPPVTSETTPPVMNETIPSVKRKTPPPVTSETTPPVTSETIPPVKRKTPPPVTSETILPVKRKTLPPVTSETTPPVTSETIQPVKRKTLPPVTSETTPPVMNETIPPVKTKTPPPVTSETTPPVTSETTTPVTSETTPPVMNETIPPVKTKTPPPVTSETTPPVTSETIRPVKRKTPPPVTSETPPPVTSETILPVKRGGVTPKWCEKEPEAGKRTYSQTSPEQVERLSNEEDQAMVIESRTEPAQLTKRKPVSETHEFPQKMGNKRQMVCSENKDETMEKDTSEQTTMDKGAVTESNDFMESNAPEGLDCVYSKSSYVETLICKPWITPHFRWQKDHEREWIYICRERRRRKMASAGKSTPDVIRTDPSSPPQYDKLSNYLKMKEREPVIGLSAIVECPSDLRLPIYLCKHCNLKIPEHGIVNHVTGFGHRMMSLKKEHPHLICDWPKELDPAECTSKLWEMAKQLERGEVYGQLKVMQTEPIVSGTSEVQPFSTSSATSIITATTSRTEGTCKTSAVTPETDGNMDTLSTPVTCCQTTDLSCCESTDFSKSTSTATCLSDNAKVEATSSSTATNSIIGIASKTGEGESKTTVTSTPVATSPTATISNKPSTVCIGTSAISPYTATIFSNTSDIFKSTATMSNETSVGMGTAFKTTTTSNTVKASSETETTSLITGTSNTVAATPKCEIAKSSEISSKTVSTLQSVVTIVANHQSRLTTVGSTKTQTNSAICQTAKATTTKTGLRGTSESTKRERPSKRPSAVGLNHLVAVLCGKREQYFCELCSVRFEDATAHMTNFSHRYRYVGLKYPGWTATTSQIERKLLKMVTHLAKVERDAGLRIQQLLVTYDEFKALSTAPVVQALEKLKAIMRGRGESNYSLSSTTQEPEALRWQVPSTGLDGASHATDGVNSSKGDVTGLSANCQSGQENAQELRKLVVRIPVFLGDDQEPLQVPQKRLEEERTNQSPALADTGSEPPHTHAEHPDPRPKTSQNHEPSKRSSPRLQDHRRPPEYPERLLPGNTEHTINRPACGLGPSQHSVPRELLSMSTGERVKLSSNLLKYLEVKGLTTQPIIGLGYVLECRTPFECGTPFESRTPTFYLCVSCCKTINLKDICDHIVSTDHQFYYMRMQYPEFILAWWEENLRVDLKMQLLTEIARKLSNREAYNKIDAQVIFLGQDWYECVQTAPFNEALSMLQKLGPLRLPFTATTQLDWPPPGQLNLEDLLLMAPQSARITDTHESTRNEVEMNSRGDGNLTACRPERDLSPVQLTPEAVQLTPDQLQSHQSSDGKALEPDRTAIIQNAALTVTIKQEVAVPEMEAQTQAEVTLVPGHSGVELNSREDGILTVCKPERDLSPTSVCGEAVQLTPDQLLSRQSSDGKALEPDRTGSIQSSALTVTVKQEVAEPEIQAQIQAQVTPVQGHPGVELNPREGGNLTAYQPDRDWSLTNVDGEAVQLTPDQRQSFQNSVLRTASIQNSAITITIKQEVVEPEVEAQTLVKITPAPEQPVTIPFPVTIKQEVVNFEADDQGQVRGKTCRRSGVCEEEQGTVPVSSQKETQPARTTEKLRATKGLQEYVSNKRTEAVVGLSVVIECSCEGQAAFYLCVACGSRLNRELIIHHVSTYKHRQQYLSVRFPRYFEAVFLGLRPREKSIELMQIAREVEEQNQDEPGTIQKVHLSLEDFKDIRAMTFDKALSRLQAIYKDQNQTELVTCVTSKPEPVKLEVVEPVISNKEAEPPQREVRRAVKHPLEEVSMSGGMEDKRRKISLDVDAALDRHSNPYPAVSPTPAAGKSQVPDLEVAPEPAHTLTVSQHKCAPSQTQPKLDKTLFDVLVTHLSSSVFNTKPSQTSTGSRDDCAPQAIKKATTVLQGISINKSSSKSPPDSHPKPNQTSTASSIDECPPQAIKKATTVFQRISINKSSSKSPPDSHPKPNQTSIASSIDECPPQAIKKATTVLQGISINKSSSKSPPDSHPKPNQTSTASSIDECPPQAIKKATTVFQRISINKSSSKSPPDSHPKPNQTSIASSIDECPPQAIKKATTVLQGISINKSSSKSPPDSHPKPNQTSTASCTDECPPQATKKATIVPQGSSVRESDKRPSNPLQRSTLTHSNTHSKHTVQNNHRRSQSNCSDRAERSRTYTTSSAKLPHNCSGDRSRTAGSWSKHSPRRRETPSKSSASKHPSSWLSNRSRSRSPAKPTPAAVSVKSLARPHTNTPQLKDPSPDKYTCSSLQPTSQPNNQPNSLPATNPEPSSHPSNSVPAVTTPPKAPTTNKRLPSNKETPSIVDSEKYAHIVTMVRERGFAMKVPPYQTSPEDDEGAAVETTTTDHTFNLPQKKVWDSKWVPFASEIQSCSIATSETFSNHLKRNLSSEVWAYENRHFAPDPNSILSTDEQSQGGYSGTGHPSTVTYPNPTLVQQSQGGYSGTGHPSTVTYPNPTLVQQSQGGYSGTGHPSTVTYPNPTLVQQTTVTYNPVNNGTMHTMPPATFSQTPTYLQLISGYNGFQYTSGNGIPPRTHNHPTAPVPSYTPSAAGYNTTGPLYNNGDSQFTHDTDFRHGYLQYSSMDVGGYTSPGNPSFSPNEVRSNQAYPQQGVAQGPLEMYSMVAATAQPQHHQDLLGWRQQ